MQSSARGPCPFRNGRPGGRLYRQRTMAVIYHINLDQTAREAIDHTRYALCSFDLIRQNFLAAQIVDRFSSWLGQKDAERHPFVVRKDPPLILQWHQRGSAATAVLESGMQIASVLLLLSGLEPRGGGAVSSIAGRGTRAFVGRDGPGRAPIRPPAIAAVGDRYGIRP
jgi:hypothetical protein